MALPQKAIDQLSREPVQTPGWSFNIMMATGTVFFLSLAIYVGMLIGYKPFFDRQLAGVEKQKTDLQNSVDPARLSQLLAYYSQLANMDAILRKQIRASKVFEWFQNNTHQNIFFTEFDFDATKQQLKLRGEAQSVEDLAEQIKIFENLQNGSARRDLLAIGFDGSALKEGKVSGSAGATFDSWPFSVVLTFDPKIFKASSAKIQ